MGFSMVYLASSSDLRISVTLNLCDLAIVTYALGLRSGKWTNSSVICKTSFVSPCFQCLGTWFDWWRGRANELIGFWIPFFFGGRFIELVAFERVFWKEFVWQFFFGYVFKGNFWLQVLLQIVSRFWMFIMLLQIHYPPGNCNITYPTLGKGTSSFSRCRLVGDSQVGPLGCLVPGAKGDDPRQALPMFSGSSDADWVVPSILEGLDCSTTS